MKTTLFGKQFAPFKTKADYVTLLTNTKVYLCPDLVNCFVCLRHKRKPITNLSLLEITEHFCYSMIKHICVITLIYYNQLQNVENGEISIYILLN